MEENVGSSWVSWTNTKGGGKGDANSTWIPAYAGPLWLRSLWEINSEGRGECSIY